MILGLSKGCRGAPFIVIKYSFLVFHFTLLINIKNVAIFAIINNLLFQGLSNSRTE
jgi:hypothetical protein